MRITVNGQRIETVVTLSVEPDKWNNLAEKVIGKDRKSQREQQAQQEQARRDNESRRQREEQERRERETESRRQRESQERQTGRR